MGKKTDNKTQEPKPRLLGDVILELASQIPEHLKSARPCEWSEEQWGEFEEWAGVYSRVSGYVESKLLDYLDGLDVPEWNMELTSADVFDDDGVQDWYTEYDIQFAKHDDWWDQPSGNTEVQGTVNTVDGLSQWGWSQGGWSKSTCSHDLQPVTFEPYFDVVFYASQRRLYSNASNISTGDTLTPQLTIGLDSVWTKSIMVTPGLDFPVLAEESPTVCIYWPDRGTPVIDFNTFYSLMNYVIAEATNKVVQVGCIGGHGRTGTFLACVGVHVGMTPPQSVQHVWSKYCPQAVETMEQYNFIRDYYKVLNDNEDWIKNPENKRAHEEVMDTIEPKKVTMTPKTIIKKAVLDVSKSKGGGK